MNLDRMRSLFAEHTSDLDNELDAAGVDEYLNRAYQYVIPTDVGGEFTESTWELRTVIGQESYPYAEYVIAPNGRNAWIDSYYDATNTLIPHELFFLDVETSQSVFERTDKYGQNNQGRPTSVLFYGRSVYLTPIPDLAYVVNIPVRAGPAAALDASGITNDIHAMATVTSAAAEFLAESEDVDGVNRESALYSSYLQRLHVYAQTRPNERRRKRSF